MLVPILLLLIVGVARQFTPSKNMEFLTELVDLDLDEKPISKTLTHMDILRKGLIRSITKVDFQRLVLLIKRLQERPLEIIHPQPKTFFLYFNIYSLK